MHQPFDFARSVRKTIAETVNGLTIDQLNTVPSGCSNNIAWQLGHIVVSTELLCYVRSRVQPGKEIPLQEKYRNGTRPVSFIQQTEIDYLLSRLITSLDAIEADHKAGRFGTLKPYATHTFGFEMQDIDTVFAACSHHDVLHAGNIGILKKLVSL